jgi:Delta24-sterol reductase
MERHRLAVSKIAAAVRAFYERREPFRINHGSTNTTRPLDLRRTVDISPLSNVLSVDPASKTALVEPNVPMDRLVEATLRHGLVPPVVMEFPGITAGGGFAGTGGESSSFRHGFFDDSVNRVEMVLADGEVVDAAPAGPRADLFAAARGAVGTLGITTLLELRLRQARRYVRTTYTRAGSAAEAVAGVERAVRAGEADFVDGILFSERHGAVITGTLTDEAPPAGECARTFSRPRDEWFYLHVRRRTAAASVTSVTEHIPLAEYLFRYDRGGFWVGRWAFTYFWMVPFLRLTRRLLDDFLHTRMMYRALHASGRSRTFVVQDLALPFRAAEAFVAYVSREFDIWPLWLCPLRKPAPPAEGGGTGWHPTTRVEGVKEGDIDATYSLNIGLWGAGPTDAAKFVAMNRALEDKVREMGGSKWLYAHTYYSEDEFWEQYGGREAYEAVRAKYKAETLPSVYAKVKVAERAEGWKEALKAVWPVGGLWGVWKSIRSKDYKLHRDAEWMWKEEEGKKKKAD